MLHSTVGAAGHNSIGLPIHYLVGSHFLPSPNPSHFLARADDGSIRAEEVGAAAEGAAAEGAAAPSAAAQGAAAQGGGQASEEAGRAPWLGQGLGLLSDGLSRGQRARVISAFQDDP